MIVDEQYPMISPEDGFRRELTCLLIITCNLHRGNKGWCLRTKDLDRKFQLCQVEENSRRVIQ